MMNFSHHRQEVRETIDSLRELIDKLQTLEEEYLRQDEKLYVISEFANDWEYWQAPDGHYKYVSPSCVRVTGYSPDDFYSDPELLAKIMTSKNWEKWKAHSHQMAEDGQVTPVEFEIHTKDGRVKWIHHICQTVTGKNGENLGIRGSNRDITEIKELQEKLKHMAGHDLLTGLPNRSLFLEYLDQTIKESKRNMAMFAVVFIDLDDFKGINDNFGHEAGDMVLKKMALTLTGVLREDDIIARMGGDEFIGLFSLAQGTDVSVIQEKIFKDALRQFHCETYDITVRYSLGISVYPKDGITADVLLQQADMAMYRQKQINKAARSE